MKTGLGSITILSGATESDAIGFQNLRHLGGLTIVGPDTLPEVVTVEVTYQDDRNTSVGAWSRLQTDNIDITIAAGEAVTISPIVFNGLRLSAGAAVAADREFFLIGDDEV